jgi:uncharacterized protein (TIGR02996 family)
MHDEDDFLRKLLENPADDTVRLVYADWLDERGDDESKQKAQFLRLTARLNERKKPGEWRTALREEMQPLAAKLPTDWLAVVSRLKIDLCGAKTADGRLEFGRRQFEFVCHKDWAHLTTTENSGVRFCEECEEHVHYCDTIVEARRHARQGHCVAVDLGIIRRNNDLAPPQRMLMGRMLPDAVEAARHLHERRDLDDVSREREERKLNEPDA